MTHHRSPRTNDTKPVLRLSAWVWVYCIAAWALMILPIWAVWHWTAPACGPGVMAAAAQWGDAAMGVAG